MHPRGGHNPRIWLIAGASAVVASAGVAVATTGGAAAAPPKQTIHVVELDTHDTYVIDDSHRPHPRQSTFNGKGEIEFTGLYDSTGNTSTITSITGGTRAYQNAAAPPRSKPGARMPMKRRSMPKG